ncbi:hypothetical protein IW262DRAFT_1302058 [Armillaria fumosa]|nr:hypothetical protein IW262DRAFT_1302058 [Armillaria fumosa]
MYLGPLLLNVISGALYATSSSVKSRTDLRSFMTLNTRSDLSRTNGKIGYIVQGLAFEYVHGTNIEDLKPGVDISQQEAEAISSRVIDVFRTIEAENCDIHNGLHIRNVILGPQYAKYEGWKKNVTPVEISDSGYDNPVVFNKYVEKLPDDYRMEMLERVSDMDWDGAKEMTLADPMSVVNWRAWPYEGTEESPILDYLGLELSLTDSRQRPSYKKKNPSKMLLR